MTGKEARREHAHHMPLDNEGRIAKSVTAKLHRQRGSRHHQDHRRITEHRRHQRHKKFWLANNLQQRTTTPAALFGARAWNLYELHNAHGHENDRHDCRVSAGELHRFEEINTDRRQLRSDKGRNDATRQDI